MTQDEIIDMAREAGFLYGTMGPSNTRFVTAIGHTFIVELEAFAKLVAAKERKEMAEHCVEITRMAVDKAVASAIEKEREACAKICDEKVDAEYATGKVDHNEMGWTQSCAIDIRARGEA